LFRKRPEKFYGLQHQFIQETHYEPVVLRLRTDTGINIGSRSQALQNVVWSTTVQNGPTGGARLIEQAMHQLPTGPATDEQLIRAIYAERGRRDASGQLVHFRGSSLTVQRSVLQRFSRELNDALAELKQEGGAK